MNQQFTSIAHNLHRTGHWTAKDCAEIFGRLITESALDNELTPDLARGWGRSAGHYGNLALAERENVTVARNAWEEAVR